MLLEALASLRVLALKVVQAILLELLASRAALPAPSRAQLRSLYEVILRRSEQQLLASQNLQSCWLVQHLEFMQ